MEWGRHRVPVSTVANAKLAADPGYAVDVARVNAQSISLLEQAKISSA